MRGLLNSILIKNPNLHTISGVDIPLGSGQKGLVDNLHSLLLALGLLLVLPGVVVSHKLRVQVRDDHVAAAALRQGLIGSVAADGVVAVDDSLAGFVEPGHQVERVVREEPSGVECLGNQVGDRLRGGKSVHFVLVRQQLHFQDALQFLVVGVHPRSRQDRLVRELHQLAHPSVHDVEVMRQTGVARHHDVVWASHSHDGSCVEAVRLEAAAVLDHFAVFVL